MRLKNLYNEMLRTDDLIDMYIDMTGIWEDDKNKFQAQQDALESFTNNLDIDDAE
jgi:hypothetical protein